MQIVTEYPNVLTKRFCHFIILIALNRLEEAETLGEQIDGYRTAQSCWLTDLNDSIPALRKIKEFVSDITNYPIENQEEIHIVKYGKGGEYKIHHDWFDEETLKSENEDKRGGNRMFSFLIYLNDDFKGGETDFPTLKHKIKPELGKGVLWKNIDEDGVPIEESEHAGLPVEEGTKWILIIWIRENKFI